MEEGEERVEERVKAEGKEVAEASFTSVGSGQHSELYTGASSFLILHY